MRAGLVDVAERVWPVLLFLVLIQVAADLCDDAGLFAFAAIWLANSSSLLLPVSNMTNLLAQDHLGLGAIGFVRESWAPQLAVLVVVVAALVLGESRHHPDRGERRTDAAHPGIAGQPAVAARLPGRGLSISMVQFGLESLLVVPLAVAAGVTVGWLT